MNFTVNYSESTDFVYVENNEQNISVSNEVKAEDYIG